MSHRFPRAPFSPAVADLVLVRRWRTEFMTRHKRHGLLTAYLVFKLVAYSLTLIAYLFASDRILALNPAMPPWILSVFIVFCIVGLVSTSAIFEWRIWGFYVICALAIAGFILNLCAHLSPSKVFLGLLGPAVLYGLLRLGENDAWSQLQ